MGRNTTEGRASMSLQGSLHELPLSDLVEMTSLGNKSGLLVVTNARGGTLGSLGFSGGRLVSATCGALHGERALYALLDIREGGFHFDPRADVSAEDFSLSTASLLIEGMRRIDEVRRLRDFMPADAIVTLSGAGSQDPTEASVLGYLGPGSRSVGDIVAGMLVEGAADEYECLRAIIRLEERAVVGVIRPARTGLEGGLETGTPSI
jgi:hypothetical protein